MSLRQSLIGAVAIALLGVMTGVTLAEPPVLVPFATPKIRGQVPSDVTHAELMEFLEKENPRVDLSDYGNLAYNYYEYGESRQYGGPLRWDWAFFQMLHETNALRYTGTVKRSQYNFAGIGAKTIDSVTGAALKGDSYGSVDRGVRGHLEHLALYAGVRIPEAQLMPYTKSVRRFILGKAVTFQNLSGQWATWPNEGRDYGRKIADYANRFGTRFQGNIDPRMEEFLKLLVDEFARAAGHRVTQFVWVSDDLTMAVRPFKNSVTLLTSRSEDGTLEPVRMQIHVQTRPESNQADPDFFLHNLTVDLTLSTTPSRMKVIPGNSFEGSYTYKTVTRRAEGQTTTATQTGRWRATPVEGGKIYEVRMLGKDAEKYPPIFRLEHVP